MNSEVMVIYFNLLSYKTVASLNHNWNHGNRLNVNGNNFNDNNNGFAFGIALASKTLIVKTYKNLYGKIICLGNLFFAYEKARKRKTKKSYVKRFEKNLEENLIRLHIDLANKTYSSLPLKTFILRDPKTRKISKSDFRDRVVHHALCNILEPIFQKSLILDSCANQKHKGNLFAIARLNRFVRKISRNGETKGLLTNNQVKGFYLKADIKHYFEEVNHDILLRIILKKIRDQKVIWLISQILNNKTNFGVQRERVTSSSQKKGMPLGNLTSQFFANIYLNELDYFVKHELKAKYYIRYVDDFVIFHNSKEKLIKWRKDIHNFLKKELRLELHSEKSRIVSLSKGIDFVGFRNFYHFKLLRKRSIRKMKRTIDKYNSGFLSKEEFNFSLQGWLGHARWASTKQLRNQIKDKINQ